MQSKITSESIFDETRLISTSPIEKTTIEVFRDPVCFSIVNPLNQKSTSLACANYNNVLCEEGLNTIKRSRTTCPVCRSPFEPQKINLKLISIFEELLVSCRYKSKGCKFVGRLGDINHHETNCSMGPVASIQSIKKTDSKCLYEHALTALRAKPFNPSVNYFQCDICGFNVSGTKADRSGKTRKWNVCNDCSLNPTKCENNHQLFRKRDLTKEYKTNWFTCNSCWNISNNTELGALHCTKCGFDLCDRCLIIKRNDLQFICDSKHLLFRVPDLTKVSKTYTSNKYVCSVCDKRNDNYNGLVLHCAKCRYHVCSGCSMKSC